MFLLRLRLYDEECGDTFTPVERTLAVANRVVAISMSEDVIREECRRGLFYFEAQLADNQTDFWEAHTLDANLLGLGFASRLKVCSDGVSMPVDKWREEIVLSERLFNQLIPSPLRCRRCQCGADKLPFYAFCPSCGETNSWFSEEALLRDSQQPVAAVQAGCRQDHKVYKAFIAKHPERRNPQLTYCVHCGNRISFVQEEESATSVGRKERRAEHPKASTRI